MGWFDGERCPKHDWKWQPTWGEMGFQECQACGTTRSVAQRQVLLNGRVWNPEDLDRETMVEQLVNPPSVLPTELRPVDTVALNPGDMVPVPSETTFRGRPSAEVAEVRRLAMLEQLAKGAKPAEVARMFGVSAARVYQVRAAAKAQEATSA